MLPLSHYTLPQYYLLRQCILSLRLPLQEMALARRQEYIRSSWLLLLQLRTTHPWKVGNRQKLYDTYLKGMQTRRDLQLSLHYPDLSLLSEHIQAQDLEFRSARM